MPRNKTKKRINKKRQMGSNILASVQKMETELMKVPSKLAAQLDKEINANKKKENKLAKALNKVQNQVMSAEKRMASAETKNSRAAKKQWKTAKKIHKVATEAQSDLNKQFQTITNTLEALLDQQSKFNSLGKFLIQFNKEWVKSSKKSKVKAKPQSKKNKSDSNNVDQQYMDVVDTATDDSRLEEITELAS